MDTWTPVPKPPIGMTPGEIRRWILKGLVFSCISAHHLHKWITGVTNRPVAYPLFIDALTELEELGVVEVQRMVTCYLCTSYGNEHPQEHGYALTRKGEQVNNELGNEEVFA